MKILHLLYDHPENPWLGGGAALRAHEINSRLVALGHQVELICGGFPHHSNDHWESDGVHFYSTPAGRSYAASRFLFNRHHHRIALERLSSQQFDLVVNDLSAFSKVVPSKFWNGATVALFHNLIGSRLFKKMGPLAPPFWWWERKMLHQHNATIAVSRWLARKAEERGVANVEVIYNGVDSPPFQIDEERDPATILYLGRIDIFQKGLDKLLLIFELVQREIPDVKLMIAGTGDELDKLKKIATSRGLRNISYVGRVGDKKYSLFARSTVVVLPSRFEGWGMVAVEAAATGTPVVGSGADGLAEAIDDGVSGLVVRGSEREFADAVIELLRSPQRRKELGEGGRRHAEQFQWERIAQQQLELYRRVVESKRGELR